MPRVLSVGQCGFDQFGLSRHLKKGFGAEVSTAETLAEALVSLRAQAFDLVLVNRVLDADGTSGLDLIRAVKADQALAATPVMLVSNYPETQRTAESLGALSGFGKSEIGSTIFQDRLAFMLQIGNATSPK